MQVKKITAKIRDMVKVSLMENGDERAWYNNIEMPDAIKELEMKDCHFHFFGDGKIEFQIHFEQGVLPKDFPEKKARKHRTANKTVVDAKPAASTGTAATPLPEAKPDGKAAKKPIIAAPVATKPVPKAEAKPSTKKAT